MTMAKKTVNERLREEILGRDELLAEYQLAMSVLVRRLGGAVEVNKQEIMEAVGMLVKSEQVGDKLQWTCHDSRQER